MATNAARVGGTGAPIEGDEFVKLYPDTDRAEFHMSYLRRMRILDNFLCYQEAKRAAVLHS